jgi:hypothetical protein
MRALVCVLAFLALAVALAAQAPPKAPEYVVAAEVTIRGVVEDIHESKVTTDHPGLHLILKTESETVEVHACPVRFLSDLDFTIAKGDTLTVVGSRPKNATVIVAREITKDSVTLTLRDKNGVPNWRGR